MARVAKLVRQIENMEATMQLLRANILEARQAATDIFAAYIELSSLLGFDLDVIQSGNVNHDTILQKLKHHLEERNESQG